MGYEIVELKYDFPYKAREIMNDKACMKEAFEIAVSQDLGTGQRVSI